MKYILLAFLYTPIGAYYPSIQTPLPACKTHLPDFKNASSCEKNAWFHTLVAQIERSWTVVSDALYDKAHNFYRDSNGNSHTWSTARLYSLPIEKNDAVESVQYVTRDGEVENIIVKSNNEYLSFTPRLQGEYTTISEKLLKKWHFRSYKNNTQYVHDSQTDSSFLQTWWLRCCHFPTLTLYSALYGGIATHYLLKLLPKHTNPHIQKQLNRLYHIISVLGACAATCIAQEYAHTSAMTTKE